MSAIGWLCNRFSPNLLPTMTLALALTLSYPLSVSISVSQVRSDRDKFSVHLDVKHFSPDELNVKITDDYVEIQGKHGEIGRASCRERV